MKRLSGVFTIFFLVLTFIVTGTASGQATGPGLLQAGPIATGPLKLFPAWYMDKTGVALEACVDGTPLCINSTLAQLRRPAAPGGGEAFYWMAVADLPTLSVRSFVELALEITFLNPVVNRANAMIFNRLRVRIDGFTPPVADGNFTIVHPFGSQVIPVAAGATEINFTTDLPGSAGLASFAGVLAAPNIGPFLAQINPPPGYIGSPDVPSAVTGGINGNVVTVLDTLGAQIATTDQFTVLGKLATNGGLSQARANYTRTADGTFTVNAVARSIGNQRIVANIGATNPLRLVLAPVAGQIGSYTGTATLGRAKRISPLKLVNTSDRRRPSVMLNPVPDLVTITNATWANGFLTVQADSGDLKRPRPMLRLIDPATGALLKTQRGSLNASIRAPFKPARVRVVSSAKGRATANVQ